MKPIHTKNSVKRIAAFSFVELTLIMIIIAIIATASQVYLSGIQDSLDYADADTKKVSAQAAKILYENNEANAENDWLNLGSDTARFNALREYMATVTTETEYTDWRPEQPYNIDFGSTIDDLVTLTVATGS